VPLDHSPLDRIALGHAAALASKTNGRLYLLHVEEGVTSQVYGSESSTAEVEAGRAYMDSLAESLGEMKIEVERAIRHGSNPRREIVRYAREVKPDLLVMDADMPGMSGLRASLMISQLHPEVTIILMSMDTGHRFVQACHDCGAHAVIYKPRFLKELSQVLNLESPQMQGPTLASKQAVAGV